MSSGAPAMDSPARRRRAYHHYTGRFSAYFGRNSNKKRLLLSRENRGRWLPACTDRSQVYSSVIDEVLGWARASAQITELNRSGTWRKTMTRKTVLAWAAAMSVTAIAFAQQSATLTLRSGERLSAQLMDLGGVGYTVRVDGQERQIPANDVAAIDFTGGSISTADWDKLSGGGQVLISEERRNHIRPTGRHRRIVSAPNDVPDAFRRARLLVERHRPDRHVSTGQCRGDDWFVREQQYRGRSRDHDSFSATMDANRRHSATR